MKSVGRDVITKTYRTLNDLRGSFVQIPFKYRNKGSAPVESSIYRVGELMKADEHLYYATKSLNKDLVEIDTEIRDRGIPYYTGKTERLYKFNDNLERALETKEIVIGVIKEMKEANIDYFFVNTLKELQIVLYYLEIAISKLSPNEELKEKTNK